MRQPDDLDLFCIVADENRVLSGNALDPASLVCKPVSANGRPTVKLSDNPRKAMGPEDQIKRYKRMVGVGEQAGLAVVVQGGWTVRPSTLPEIRCKFRTGCPLSSLGGLPADRACQNVHLHQIVAF